ncbi:hypothetical protein K438DRAFT_2001766 [Mycena galopus ATCC 62051]|nr:hypothetical protein K438DRAFT_2001766 [Mycena galopus ATCC 62051]
MCLGDNSATLSARYLNAQLKAMWENAVECANHDIQPAVDFRSHEYQKHKYTRSLAEFYFAGEAPRGLIAKDGMFFNGTFGEPRLEFICNHEVALYLSLKSGHFNKVYPNLKVARGYKATSNDHFEFENLEVAFRVKFSRRTLGGKDTRIGSGTHLIQMMVLDFASAQMVLFHPDLPAGTADSLEWYLRKYLTVLQNAGHHVRFDLPDFDDATYKPNIDYSLATRAFVDADLCAGVDVHGIAEWKINEFLRQTWLDIDFKMGALTDKVSGCLSQIESNWIPHLDQHFRIEFGPPRIRALCKHEVVLYFTAANVFFYESQDFASRPIESFENWEFAFIVNVVEDKFNETAEPSLRIDISSARFCRHLSTIFAEEVNLHFTYLITFFQEHYLNLLSQYEMISIYYPGGKPDFEAPGFEEIEESSEWKEIKEGSTSTTVVVWTDIVKEIKLYGYDHLIAISEVSINALFDNLRKTVGGCLVEWSYEGFYAQFSDMRVKLLSSNQALVTFTIQSGYLTPDDMDKFHEWTISYKVDIKMVDQTELHSTADWVAHYGGLSVSVGGGGIYRTVRHIILDFANAKYIFEHSSQPGMWDHGALVAKRQFGSFRYFIEKYLDVLSTNGHNIIHSTPIVPISDSFGFTDVSFQIVSKEPVTAANCVFHREAPVLVVYGMMSGRPMPQAVIQWGHGWVVPGRIPSHGTVVLSRECFLESKLLAMLEVVNRRTTVVPRFPGADEEEWKVHLTTWDDHHYRRNERCNWKKVAQINPGWLEYAWEHRDEWTYEHEGTHNQTFAYAVLCHTKNQLCIPTMYRPRSMEIVLRGEYRRNERCNWKKVAQINPGWLEYAWEHRDEWTYEHEGTHNQTFAYAVLCHTKNQLCIPTMYRPRSMEIVLRGESVLRLKSKDNKDHSNWTKRSSAKWSVKMNVNTDASGLRVTLAEQVHPVFDKTESEGAWDIDTHELLATHLPRIIDVGEVINGLKDVFEGAWKLSCAGSKTYSLGAPMFTQNGDIIIQLGGFVELAPTKVPNSLPASPFKLQPARSAGGLSPMKPFVLPNALVTSATSPPLTPLPDAEGFAAR